MYIQLYTEHGFKSYVLHMRLCLTRFKYMIVYTCTHSLSLSLSLLPLSLSLSLSHSPVTDAVCGSALHDPAEGHVSTDADHSGGLAD